MEWVGRSGSLRQARRDRRRVRQEGQPSGSTSRGRLQTRKWQDKDGQDRYTTEIVADRMQMLGGRASNGNDPTPAKRRRTRSRSGRRAKFGFAGRAIFRSGGLI